MIVLDLLHFAVQKSGWKPVWILLCRMIAVILQYAFSSVIRQHSFSDPSFIYLFIFSRTWKQRNTYLNVGKRFKDNITFIFFSFFPFAVFTQWKKTTWNEDRNSGIGKVLVANRIKKAFYAHIIDQVFFVKLLMCLDNFMYKMSLRFIISPCASILVQLTEVSTE